MRGLPTPWQGHYFEATSSTQDEAREAARRGAPSRSIYVANFQGAGRGRQGRIWRSPPGSALLLSVIFREKVAQPVPWRFTNLVALALCDSVRHLLPEPDPTIKWPNDVMLNRRKLAGVLAETSFDGIELVAVVGLGVNVNSTPADLVDLPSATSLKIEAVRDVDRSELLRALVNQLDQWLSQPVEEVQRAWAARLWGRGQRLRLLDVGREEEVVVLGVENDGALLVRLDDGTERRTTTGELLA